MNILTPSFFINNRHKLIESIDKKGIIVVPGNGVMQRSADTTYPFRQDSNLYYLTGVTEPCATLVIDTVHDETFIMLPFREGVYAIFDGEIDVANLRQQSGVGSIISEKEGWKRLRQMANHNFYVPQKPMSRVRDMYTNPHRAAVLTKLKTIAKEPLQDIRHNISTLRMIKTQEELRCIETAVGITYDSIQLITQKLQTYQSERELAADISREFLIRGAAGHAYEPIVASGLNSCTLHYEANNAPLVPGSVVLFDIGAEVSQYASDISRTFVVGVEPNTRQQEVLDAVADAQAEIIEFLKPGIEFKQLANYADETVARKLVQLKLIPTTHTKEDIRTYFPHAISHFLGLDAHDAGDYTQPLHAGMVITVEPGIYIRNESIGVRIEDDIVITKNGAKIIGKS